MTKHSFLKRQESDKNHFLASKVIFIKHLAIWSFIDVCYELRSYERGVAQLGSAGALGALGRRFESCRPDHLNPSYTSEFPRLAFLLENMTTRNVVK